MTEEQLTGVISVFVWLAGILLLSFGAVSIKKNRITGTVLLTSGFILFIGSILKFISTLKPLTDVQKAQFHDPNLYTWLFFIIGFFAFLGALQVWTRRAKISVILLSMALVFGIIAPITNTVLIHSRNDKIIAPFQEHIMEYINFTKLMPGTKKYIEGTIITVNINDSTISPLYLELPAELQAKMPNEVTTVVWLDKGDIQRGTYSDGSVGYQHYYKVTVINKADGSIIDEKTYYGSEPPKEKTHNGSDAYGGDAASNFEILNYLCSLQKI